MPKRVDVNQPEIVKALRGVGASVHCTHEVADGFVDIVVGWQGVNYMMEIKDGSKPPSKRKLTPDEEEFHGGWKGKLHIVNSITEAIGVLNGKL